MEDSSSSEDEKARRKAKRDKKWAKKPKFLRRPDSDMSDSSDSEEDEELPNKPTAEEKNYLKAIQREESAEKMSE